MVWIALRLTGIFLLVFLSYNTFSSVSYWHWLWSGQLTLNTPIGAAKVLVGLLLLVAWGLLVYATKQAKGLLGTAISLAVFSAIVWFLHTLTIIRIDSAGELFTWIQIVVAIVLSLGSFWSSIWRRFTGQVAVNDTDDV